MRLRTHGGETTLVQCLRGAFDDLKVRGRIREDEWQPPSGSKGGQPFAVGGDGTRARMEGHAVVLGEHHVLRPGEVWAIGLTSDRHAMLLDGARQARTPEEFEHSKFRATPAGVEADAALREQSPNNRHAAARPRFDSFGAPLQSGNRRARSSHAIIEYSS